MPIEDEINSRKAHDGLATRNDGEGLVNPTGGEIGFNEHFIGVNLVVDI